MKSNFKIGLFICLVSLSAIFSKAISSEVTERYINAVSEISSKVFIQIPY